jgi:hypothetical protein
VGNARESVPKKEKFFCAAFFSKKAVEVKGE